ncbi:MAG: ATP-binding protein [Syntrophobacteria bacterium]
MIKLFPNLHLSIRQKVVVGFTVSIIAFLLVGIVAYRNIVEVETKISVVERARELHDTILEVRRYEKNFLLYGTKKDYQQTMAYVEQGKEITSRVQSHVKGLKGGPYLEELSNELGRYAHVLDQMGDGYASQPAGKDAVEAQLRQRGKNLVDLSLKLANFEQRRIEEILKSLKKKLAALLLVLVFLGLFLTMLVSHKIVRPLHFIQKTTQRIARGNYRPLPVFDTRDETQSVVEAFNKMVAELEIRQDQLVQAQKLSSLGILTSGIAHQLNNPLNNISTSCQILLEETAGEESNYIKKLLKNIDSEVDRARDIVKGLLEFSREREPQPNWVNVENLLIKTIRLISSQLPSGVEVTYDVPEDLDIYADYQHIQEVLLNLLFNAVQAMPDDTGLIDIVARKDTVNGQVRIEVHDAGCGISPEHLPQIFDPFFSTKEVRYGTGLGLSVAHGIVEQHGGSLTAKSTVGEGSTFIISLPFKDYPDSGDRNS